MTYKQLAAEYVERGASLLDQKVPDWWERIDLDAFDINSCSDCVIGQIFGRYCGGLSELGFSEEDAEHYCGFDHVTLDSSNAYDELMETYMNAAWRDEINRRQHRE